MEVKELQRSQKAFDIETRFILGAAVVVALLAGLCMRLFMQLAFSTYLFSGLLTFLIVMLIAWSAILIRNKKWKDTHYSLGKDALLITQPTSFFSTTQDVYLYESILSASLKQGYFGKKYGYGDLCITIPKLNTTLLLKDIVKPAEQLPILKSRIDHKGAERPRALIT